MMTWFQQKKNTSPESTANLEVSKYSTDVPGLVPEVLKDPVDVPCEALELWEDHFAADRAVNSRAVSDHKEIFEIIKDDEIDSVKPRSIDDYNQRLEDALQKLEEVGELTDSDLKEVRGEIRHLEERLHFWREVRGITITRLRQIADYMESLGRRTGIARVVGSGGGILAGSLTVAGGVLTVLTAGAAAPVLIAGASIGLASGITGGAATLTRKVMSSRQMKEVEIALEVDAAATSELNLEVDRVKGDSRLLKVTSVAFTVGGLATSTKGFVDLVRGADPGSTITAGLEVVGKIFGEDVNKEITKLLLQTSGRVLSGAVTSVFGGVTLLWDIYQLKGGIQELAAGGQEGAREIRNIARQLEVALFSMEEEQQEGVQNDGTDSGSSSTGEK